jgi:hypothetical protein
MLLHSLNPPQVLPGRLLWRLPKHYWEWYWVCSFDVASSGLLLSRATMTEMDASSGLGTLRNQVRETRPLKTGITIFIVRRVAYAEHAQHVLTYLP